MRNFPPSRQTVYNEDLYFLDVTKPQPVDESGRLKQLKDAKEKFRSKHFWNDASKFTHDSCVIFFPYNNACYHWC